MREARTERLVRLAASFILHPAKLISLTELAGGFKVSKTVISDDIEVIGSAVKNGGVGAMTVERGRSGGARFLPGCSGEARDKFLLELAETLSDKERCLPGGLVYYSDLIFNPQITLTLGFIMASLFREAEPDTVMTSEVKGIPVALFAAYALGVPLAVCRFRNRPSDGSAVCVHYPTGAGDVRTMYMGMRQLKKGSRVLIVDDFMRGGSTSAAMMLMAKQFDAQVTGIGIFIAAEEPKNKAIPDYCSLLTLSLKDGASCLKVTEQRKNFLFDEK